MKTNYFVLANTRVYRELPKCNMELVGTFQIQFYSGDDGKMGWEILDFEGFEYIRFLNGEELDSDKHDTMLKYTKDIFDVDVIDTLERDLIDIINDVGVEQFFTDTTGLKLA